MIRGETPKSKSRRMFSIGVASASFAAALLFLYLWLTPKAKLDEHGYDLTIALYRTCNQKDANSLDAIERVLAEAGSESNLSKHSRAVVTRVMGLAKSGYWREATIECRAALDNQVQRH
ncbi:hypothetical protein Poly59_58790 [Rubripirellula reticaptiva]|uniref:Uncharacterized protein n=1 Tax=Rubripirellula reticaptiva TaxID=2528013 RepID=A0A5C6EEI8_9BACT|nr:hypothetical protein Poly59_58790 [Rubripirellula reticaptiva]